ncbi:MAG: hypothetical protein KAT68_15705 [Bacteroidales bacterium]|nr:hypothetical protein [Bacteroidales bacterium]
MSNQKFSDSVKKIISLFNDIDNKILYLNDSSGKDFLTLNNVQKDYYKHLRILSDNISKIKNLKIVNELEEKIEKNNKSLDSISNYLNESGIKNSNLLVCLKNITNKIAILKIAINNIVQTNTTLKLLGTSQLLNLTFNKSNTRHETKSELSVIDDLISSIEAKNEEIKTVIKSLNTDINNTGQLVITNLKTISSLNGKLIIEYSNLKKLNDLKKYFSDDLSTISTAIDKSFSNSNEVIINLQYHDIIRQKMEHIQLLLKEIIEELDNTKLEKDTEELIRFNTKYITQIPQIAMLQTGQLIKINSEFQTATTSIVKNLNNTAENILNVLSSLNEINISSTINILAESCDKTLKKSIESWQKLDEKNKMAQDVIGNIAVKCASLIGHFEQLDILSDTIIEKVSNIIKKLNSNDSSKNEQVLPANKYFQNILEWLINSKNGFVLLNKDFIQFKNNLNSYYNSFDSETDRFEFKKQVSEIGLSYQNISNKLNKYLEINISNNEIKNFFSSNQNTNIDNINYYDYYNHTVNELIVILKKIIIILNDGTFHSDETIVEFINDIENIKNNYTVGSEFKVHDTMFSSGKISQDTTENIDASDDDGIELF